MLILCGLSNTAEGIVQEVPTERMMLRRFTVNDARALFELDNDAEVMRYINGGVPTPWEVIEEKILPVFLCRDERCPVYGFWLAQGRVSGEFLGWYVFRPRSGCPRSVEIGYRFRRVAWGLGYATEGARVLLELGFARFGVDRVIATTYEGNLASQRVMAKLGMKLVRRFRVTVEELAESDTHHDAAGEVWEGDDLEYALNRADWQRAGVGPVRD